MCMMHVMVCMYVFVISVEVDVWICMCECRFTHATGHVELRGQLYMLNKDQYLYLEIIIISNPPSCDPNK